MPDHTNDTRPVLILSTADYWAPVWTNKQHIASRLSQSRPVFYIESIGLRPPKFSLKDARRIASRLQPRRSAPLAQKQPDKLTIIRPILIPFHSMRWVRRLNSHLLRWTLRRHQVPNDALLYSFSPLDYGLSSEYKPVVYHSVDLLHNLEGLPSRLLLDAERRLLASCDMVIASSSVIAHHLKTATALPVHLYTNVADTDLFASRSQPPTERTGVVFAGHLTTRKVDVQILKELADQLPQCLHLVGPIAIDGSDRSAFTKLLSHRNVQYHGVLSQSQLASVLGRARVGIVPYKIDPHTAGIFPMKIYEYLAAGCAVVTTPLPALSHFDSVDPQIVSISGRGNFVERVISHSSTNPRLEQLTSRASFAEGNSWESRIGEIAGLLASITATGQRE